MQRLVGDVRLVTVVDRPRPKGEFDAHIAEAVAMNRSVRVVLVIELEPGANLDATERRRPLSAGLFAAPTAVVTESHLASFIMTAVKRLGVSNVSASLPHEFGAACDALRIAPELRAGIRRAIPEMSESLLPSARDPGAVSSLVKRLASPSSTLPPPA